MTVLEGVEPQRPARKYPGGQGRGLQSLVLALALVLLAACKKQEPVAPVAPPVGRLVIYPGRGVMRVDGHETHEGKVFVKLMDANAAILLPEENLARVVRPAMSAAQAEVLAVRLADREGVPDVRHGSLRFRDAMRTLVKGTCAQQADALHQLYLSPYRPGFGELKLMAQLEDVVLAEVVLARGSAVTLDEVAAQRAQLSAQLRSVAPAFARDAKERPPEPPLQPPSPRDPFSLPKTDYLGTFVVRSGKIAAGDPVLIGADAPGPADRQRFTLLDAVNGTWHAYVRTSDDGVAALMAFADPGAGGAEGAALERLPVGRAWVDSGQMAILDGAQRTDPQTADEMLFPLFQQTLVLDRGCMSSSGGGDGDYPVLAAKRDGKAVWIAVDFEEEPGGKPTRTMEFMRATEKRIKAGAAPAR